MNFEHWLAFTVTTFLICAAPGPNMLLMLASGTEHGARRTFFTMLGCFSGVLILITGSVVGVGALLQASPRLFDLLRYAGAFYLAYLGIRAWRVNPANRDSDCAGSGECKSSDPVQPLSRLTGLRLFRRGFMVAMSNPKALIFAAAFFPQFIDVQAPQLPQMMILLVTFSVLEFICYTAYALGGSRLAALLMRPAVHKGFNRLVGGLFIVFGITIVLF